jgi:hypothetical protein
MIRFSAHFYEHPFLPAAVELAVEEALASESMDAL